MPLTGVLSAGHRSMRRAVAQAFPAVPHPLCPFHSLQAAAQPISEADRHAKQVRKKPVRGVRPLARAVEGRTDPEAEVIRGDCSAVRSALTDDGRPPWAAAGLQLPDRLNASAQSRERREKRGPCPRREGACGRSCDVGWTRRRRCGPRCRWPMAGGIAPRTSGIMPPKSQAPLDSGGGTGCSGPWGSLKPKPGASHQR